MRLPSISVRHPVGVTVCALVSLMFGILALSRIGLDLLPNIKLPYLAVATVYPGADPITVEEQVTRPIESVLASTAGLKGMDSVSMENLSVVMLNLNWGISVGETLDNVNAMLGPLASQLPDAALKPMVVPIDPSQFPLAILGMSGELDPVELTRLANEVIKPRLEQVPGVARVAILGGTQRQITVAYDSAKLAANDIDPLRIYQILQFQNVVVPAGPITDGDTRYNARVGSRLRSAADVESLVIGENKTVGREALGFGALIPKTLTLKDVAEVKDESRPPEGFTRINGKPALLLEVIRQPGANTVLVARAMHQALRQLEQGSARQVRFHTITDQSEFIVGSLKDLASSAIVGATLAVLVLFLFLKSARAVAIIGISIPLSLMFTIALIYFGGLTLNLMSLGGLALGVGMLVDNSIVVLENIFRRWRAGEESTAAAQTGAIEVTGAIFASTLTSVVVFLPVVFLATTTGNLFRELGIAVSISLAASLLVAITLVPSLAARMLRKGQAIRPSGWPAETSGDPEEPALSQYGWLESVQAVYASGLRWMLRRPVVAVGLLVVFLLGSVALAFTLRVEFLPEIDGNMVTVNVELPPGSPIAQTDAVSRQVEAILRALPEVVTVAAEVGDQGDQHLMSALSRNSENAAEITAILTPRHLRKRSAKQIAAEVRSQVAAIPNVYAQVSSNRLMDSLTDSVTDGLTVVIRGHDFDRLATLSEQLIDDLKRQGGFIELRSSASNMQPEILWEVDLERGLLGGLTAGQIGLTLRSAMTGVTATYIHDQGQAVPVLLQPPADETRSIDALSEFVLFSTDPLTHSPVRVKLGKVAKPVFGHGPQAILHQDRARIITVTAKAQEGGYAEAVRQVKLAISRLDLPDGYSAHISGSYELIEEGQRDLLFALLIAALLVYGVMAVLFESWIQPFVIFMTVPLAVVGALGLLAVTGEALGVPALMGIVLLVGIAVNNGIVLVDYMNQLRQRGMPLEAAVMSGARARLRPVLMTAITTVLGLVPLALGYGQGSEIQVPLALSVLGGMISSTILTLFIIPVLYRLFVRSKRSVPVNMGANVDV